MTPPSEEYRLITLSQGQFAKVDCADFEWLNQWKWCAMWGENAKSFYAARIHLSASERKQIRMHRLILGLDKGDKRIGDHTNHDTLDNRRSNLRICSTQQNNCNVKLKKSNTSGFKGVAWHKGRQKWRAYGSLEGRQKHIGYYETAEQASTAYEDFAKYHYGEFFFSGKNETPSLLGGNA